MPADILSEVESFRSLEQVMLWAFARKPPAELSNVVTQDEFTHDIVIRVSPDVFLSFDTT
jgi:hypothetical protein